MARDVESFLSGTPFMRLEAGDYSRSEYDEFIANVVRAHIRSPKLVAFLFALAPPGAASEHLRHNLLEELGLEEADGVSHPDLLVHLARGAGLESRIDELAREADDDLKRYTSDPLLYGTLKEIGFAVLVEVTGFEYMLSRCAGRIEKVLARHRGLDSKALEWFTHHSEVDVEHAEEGLTNAQLYADWYGFTSSEAETLIDMTLRENVFTRRYFPSALIAVA